jgi:TRAP transporter TAXI family solute receptor
MRRLALALLLLLAGCGGGPEPDQLRQDVAQRLGAAFQPGTFEVVALHPRGGSDDAAAPAGEHRRVVYYDATLRLTRDLDFGGWDTPGVASLVTVLGAGPKGVRGTKPGGNHAGDEIIAHGTALYRQAEDGWREVVPAGFTAPVAPALDEITAPTATGRLMTALQLLVQTVPAGTSPAARAVIDQELSQAVATIRSRLVRLSNGFPIAAGPEGGQYVRFVQALQATKPMGLVFQALLTEGSVENLRLLQQGQVPLAMVQGDLARHAFLGTGSFTGHGAFTDLRALASLYPEPLHIIVRADSPIRTVAELRQRRIGVGPPGSGTRATAERVLAVHGLVGGRDCELDEAPLSAALVALGAGRIDAVMQVIGMPADQIRAAAASVPLRLLPLDAPAFTELMARDPAMLRGVIPRDTYPGVDHDTPTVTVAALLATTTALSAGEARTLIRAIFGADADLVGSGSVQGGQVDIGTARAGVAIPLAADAEAALAELAADRTGRR